MPPKAKITREMIIDAAFEIARTEGADQINARTAAQKLGCSTQPVMYHFAKIEDLKRAVYAKVDQYHTEYLTDMEPTQTDVMREIGLRYIRFAIEEKHLFRFLFQSGFVSENSLGNMINAEALTPILGVLQEALGMNMEQTRKVFLTIAMFVHGYASIIANNSLVYDEAVLAADMERTYRGAVLAVREEMNEKNI